MWEHQFKNYVKYSSSFQLFPSIAKILVLMLFIGFPLSYSEEIKKRIEVRIGGELYPIESRKKYPSTLEFERNRNKSIDSSGSGPMLLKSKEALKQKNNELEMILKAAKQLTNSNLVSASRLFAGPDMYPPKEFAAYGIFAFRSLPTTEETNRYRMLCYAYLATLPSASTLKQLSTLQQMVTIWPLEDNKSAHHLNHLKIIDESICYQSIDSYGFTTSIQAIKDAKLSGVEITGPGPFLLAWSPAKQKGKKGFPVLAADFSNVTTMKEAKRILLVWRDKIESDSSTWENGFVAAELRDRLRLLVDNWGLKLWHIFKIGTD